MSDAFNFLKGLIMGPAILIDKSTFQSLSKQEVFYLQSYYIVVYCPTLFYEILGDLTKYKDLEASKREVGIVSYKIYGGSSCFTTDVRTLLIGELMGHKVGMDGRPVLSGGHEVIDDEGKKGVFFDESPEYEALRRWTAGEFSEAEKLHSENWRNSIKQIDLNIAKYNSKYMEKRINDFNELQEYTSVVLEEHDSQLDFLQFLLNQVSQDSKTRNQVCERWLKSGMPNIKEFAPYAYHYLSAYMRFYIGIAKDLIGTRSSNIIDLEYILYLPFCKVFTSTDKFLRDFSQNFLTTDQVFIWGDDLKDDLKSFCNYWDKKGDKARFSYQKQYGHYPPEISNSLTCEIWKNWAGERKKQQEMAPEEKEQIQKKINSILDQIKNK